MVNTQVIISIYLVLFFMYFLFRITTEYQGWNFSFVPCYDIALQTDHCRKASVRICTLYLQNLNSNAKSACIDFKLVINSFKIIYIFIFLPAVQMAEAWRECHSYRYW